MPGIYKLLATPQRELLLAEPLPSRAVFLRRTANDIRAAVERYYCLERTGNLEGIIRILPLEESCEIWGAALRTLFYHCGRIAFEELRLPRLWWCVRANNRRMIRTCELFRIRRIGESSFYHVGHRLDFLAAGILVYYEFTPEEFYQRVPLMQRCAMSLSNYQHPAVDIYKE